MRSALLIFFQKRATQCNCLVVKREDVARLVRWFLGQLVCRVSFLCAGFLNSFYLEEQVLNKIMICLLALPKFRASINTANVRSKQVNHKNGSVVAADMDHRFSGELLRFSVSGWNTYHSFFSICMHSIGKVLLFRQYLAIDPKKSRLDAGAGRLRGLHMRLL